jgi:hypothetical protein
MPTRTARSAEAAAAEAERVATMRREAARARLHEAERLLRMARRPDVEPGKAVEKAREGAAR